MDTIILASRNKDKIAELRQTLNPLGITLKSSTDFPELEEVIEDRETLKDNALKKARYTHQKTELPALSDDTGLEVEALNGRPGVYSARYAAEDASYQDNVDKLLQELANTPPVKRQAQFRTVVAFVTTNDEFTFEGVCKGLITEKEQGDGGFGYDPVFQPDAHDSTFAELSNKQKNTISHRGKAIDKFVEWLQTNT